MSNDTPMTDAEHTRLVRISEGPDWIAGKDYVDMRKHSETLERENARLREEVEMLNVRHAAAMLHAQTHADEYNALREDEKGLLQDIQWLTEEAFKRDEELSLANGTIESRDRNIATLQEELAEAKLGSDRLLSTMHAEEEKLRPLIEKAGCDPQHHGADIAIKELLQRAEQAESRALANEKDADKQWYLGVRNALNRLVETPHEDWPDAIEKMRAENDARYAAIGAKHD